MTRAMPLLLLAAVTLVGVACRSTSGSAHDEASPQKTVLTGHTDAGKYSAIVYFDAGSPTIREAGRHELMWFSDKIRRYPDAGIEVKGFAEESGPDAAKPKLADERARNVARFLESQGIAPSRITQAGSGGASPASTSLAVGGHTNHRRVTVTVR